MNIPVKYVTFLKNMKILLWNSECFVFIDKPEASSVLPFTV